MLYLERQATIISSWGRQARLVLGFRDTNRLIDLFLATHLFENPGVPSACRRLRTAKMQQAEVRRSRPKSACACLDGLASTRYLAPIEAAASGGTLCEA